MIRSAVGIVLFIYFLGSNAMAPIRPDFFGDPLVVFHREVNRGLWHVVGPPVRATQQMLGYSNQPATPMRPPAEDEAQGRS